MGLDADDEDYKDELYAAALGMLCGDPFDHLRSWLLEHPEDWALMHSFYSTQGEVYGFQPYMSVSTMLLPLRLI